MAVRSFRNQVLPGAGGVWGAPSCKLVPDVLPAGAGASRTYGAP